VRARALPVLLTATLPLAAGVLATACSSDGTATVTVEGEVDETTTVLFVRGADGTGGGQAGGEDLHLSDIADDTADQGFASLAERLRDDGFEVAQEVEGPDGVDFAGGVLDGVDVLVLGSNNADYGEDQVTAVEQFVRAGGGLLVFNDANYGRDSYADAPDSDNAVLAPFDLMINHDDGADGAEPTTAAADTFSRPDHPVLEGVTDGITWFGAGAVTVLGDTPSVKVEILVPMNGDVMVDGDARESRPADPDTDAAVAVVEFGGGRVAAVLDRDMFFNNGQVSLATASNQQLATNLIEWLAGRR
jgi:hypothetical protein